MSLLSRNTISIGLRSFGEVQSKTMRAYAQSGQYHTIVESHALNLDMSIQSSNVEQRTPKEKGVEVRLRGDALCSSGGVG